MTTPRPYERLGGQEATAFAQQAARLYQGGMSLRDVADRLATSRTRVTNALTAAGVPIRDRNAGGSDD